MKEKELEKCVYSIKLDFCHVNSTIYVCVF